MTNLSTEDRCSCENDSITSHHRAFEWFGPGFSKLRRATRGVKLRKAGKACGERVADLVWRFLSSMDISGLPQTERLNSLTDHSAMTCAGMQAESIPVRIASHCSSISRSRISVSRSTNSSRFANVTTI